MKQNPLLETVNTHLSVDMEWHPLVVDSVHSGTTNHLYTGCYQGQTVVLRLNTAKQTQGICRPREEKVLNLIGDQTWAPDVLACRMPDQSQPGWLLMSCYAALDDNPIADRDGQILACVSEWQQIKGPPLFDYPALWDEYQQKIDELGGSLHAQELQRVLDSIRALMSQLSDIAGVENCLVHHDLHPGNLLSSRGKLIVIDWEYAGLGTPWLDAAALVTAFSIPLKAVASLPAFRYVDSEAFVSGINIAQQINQQLSQLWYECR